MLNSTQYDFLKKVVQIGLPALSTLYFTLGALWGLPLVEQVVGTLAALAVFLGVILGLSSRAYSKIEGTGAAPPGEFDGEINLTPDSVNDVTNLTFSIDPVKLTEKNQITLQINRHPPQ